MGKWAEIKKFINSTLGTDEAEPLDRMIKRLYRTLVVSNTEQKVVTNTEVTYELESSSPSELPVVRNIGTIVINAEGSIRLKVSAKNRNNGASIAVAVSDFAGNRIYTQNLTNVPNDNTYRDYNFDISVSRGMGAVNLELLIKTDYAETNTFISYVSINKVSVCYDEIEELPKAIL